MPRVKGWERALLAEVARHKALPFEHGTSDCFVMPMDCVMAVTGEDPWVDQRDYTSEFGAAKRLTALGFGNVGDAFAAKFAEIHPAIMGRGDLAVVEQDGATCGVVCIGAHVVGKSESGCLMVPRSSVARAFKVG